MRTTIEQLREIVISDLHRGIYSLQTLLLRGPYDLKKKMKEYSRSHLTRLSCRQTYPEQYFRLLVESGSDEELVSYLECCDQPTTLLAYQWKRPSDQPIPPLMHGVTIAIQSRNVSRVALLLDKYSQVNPQSVTEENRRANRFSLFDAFLTVTYRGLVGIARLLIDHVDFQVEHFTALIRRATARHHTEIVNLLLEKGDDQGLDMTPAKYEIDLYLVAWEGQSSIFRSMMDEYLDTNDDWPDVIAECLNAAASNGHIEIVRMIVDKVDRDNFSCAFDDAFKHAAQNGHKEIVEYLGDA